MTNLNLLGAGRLVLTQALVAISLALLTWLLFPEGAIHVLAGGVIATIANVIFALLLFSGKHRNPPETESEVSIYAAKATGRILGTEMIKLSATAGLIAAYMVWIKPDNPKFAVAFGVAFLVVYLLPGIVANRD